MSFNDTVEKSECPVPPESLDMDRKLANLRCPFTWIPCWVPRAASVESEEIYTKRKKETFQRIVDRQEYVPEGMFIYYLMQAFEHTMQNNLLSAMEQMNQAEQALVNIRQKAGLKDVENALQHIFIGTKCYVLKKIGNLTEVNQLLIEIVSAADMNEAELAMLSGCQCSVLLLYNTDDSEKSIVNCINKAIEYEPSNGKWYLLLGKIYRKHRRNKLSLGQQPDEIEMSAYKQAYKLSPNALTGVSLARLYRESGDFRMANTTCKEVHAFEPNSCVVRLQLALGFIRMNEPTLAKDCLDYVVDRMPDALRYSHYMGIYEEKCNKDFEAALPYYKKTTMDLNRTAEWQYVHCKKTVEPDWDPLPYLLGLLKKYDGYPSYFIQEINIQIGSYYLFEMHDVLSACQYLTIAIEIDPNNKRLTGHSLLFKPKRVNIYCTLTEAVRRALKPGTAINDEDKITVLKNTLELCRKNYIYSCSSCVCFRAQATTLRLSNSNRNSSQGSTAHVEIANWREERSSSSFRGFPRNYPSSSRGYGPNLPARPFCTNRGRDYTSWRS